MTRTVVVQSEIEGYEECFVEVADGWTVRELNALADPEAWRELWLRKVVALSVDTADGEALTEPQQVVDRYDDLDVALARFVNTSLSAAVGYMATLGGAKRRVSSGATGSPTMSRTPKTTN
ncbi:MAG: hypothetical protein KDE01_07610 [Caldilineaceae bacterium]|nr:hypothetical protein [Caldilinea sp.]MCB0147504.1 hypothetical protein [Caldilineaceae bacterium]